MTEDDADEVRGPASRSADAAGSEGSGPATRTPQGATAGGMIRAAREAQGIDLGSLAAMLKIPMKKLEALEADRHDELPGASFERALAQAACRALQIDPRPVLALLPAKATSLDRVAGSLNEPFRERQPSRGGDLGEASSMLMRPAVLLPALLLLAAVALMLLPPSLLHRVGRQVGLVVDEPASAPAVPAASAPGLAATPADLGNGLSASAPALPAASGPLFPPGEEASAPAATAPATVPAGTGTGAVVAAAPAPAPGASAAAPAALTAAATAAPAVTSASAGAHPNGPVVITTHQASWVEVVDAQGRTLVSRTVAAGESLGLEGAMPMKVKIGNAQGTTVTLRGQNVDLGPWVRDNVARLQLK